jgi:multicomponent K+:H+ antiporter subunit A
MTPLIRIVSLAVLPIAILISLAHVLRAESGPGDGFTAGIISSLGLTVEYLAFGYEDARRRIEWIRFDHVLFGGLLLATVAAVIPLLVGAPALGLVAATIPLPWVGDVRLTQALLLDFGIYFAVVGGAMSAIDSLEGAIR